MSPERSHAYRRVMQTLNDLGPSKLQPSEEELIRDAADTVIFSAELAESSPATAALDDVDRLLASLVKSERWHQVTADRLANDLFGCGPAPTIALNAA